MPEYFKYLSPEGNTYFIATLGQDGSVYWCLNGGKLQKSSTKRRDWGPNLFEAVRLYELQGTPFTGEIEFDVYA